MNTTQIDTMVSREFWARLTRQIKSFCDAIRPDNYQEVAAPALPGAYMKIKVPGKTTTNRASPKLSIQRLRDRQLKVSITLLNIVAIQQTYAADATIPQCLRAFLLDHYPGAAGLE